MLGRSQGYGSPTFLCSPGGHTTSGRRSPGCHTPRASAARGTGARHPQEAVHAAGLRVVAVVKIRQADKLGGGPRAAWKGFAWRGYLSHVDGASGSSTARKLVAT